MFKCHKVLSQDSKFMEIHVLNPSSQFQMMECMKNNKIQMHVFVLPRIALSSGCVLIISNIDV